jgi:hypothetical protein
MIRQRVELIRATNPRKLQQDIDDFNTTNNVFATQIFPPTTKDESWTAFIHYRETKE